MLEELRISGLGVIDDAVLELSAGLTVVTGETGAGKTMVVTGLGLLFGARSDAGLVRTGSKRAAVDGRIRVPVGGPLAQRLDELGADIDLADGPDIDRADGPDIDRADGADIDLRDGAVGARRATGSLLISRVLSADGRSRAQVGGRSVPVAMLAELADELIAVHGQSDQLRLRSPARQREAIDRFGGVDVAKPLAAYRAVHREYVAVEAAFADLTANAQERAREAAALRAGLAEIEAAAPQAGEDMALVAELAKLSHADLLRSAAASAHAGLLGDPAGDDVPDAVGLVAGARAVLERVAAHDEALVVLANRLAEAGFLLADVAAELAAYVDDVDADPRRLAAAQQRQAVLSPLVRRYVPDAETAGSDGVHGVDGVLAWAAAAAGRLADLDDDGGRLAELAAASARLHESMADAATRLSAARTRAAHQFGEAVTTELHALAMPHAVVAVDIRSGVAFGPNGADEVEVLLTPHTGAPPRPLARGASGGELSRVMLAVEVVFAGADPVPTFVFDEVDAGVGGRAAVEVGRRLARLARTAQVIVVTHLPQVAAFADRHLVVEKSDVGLVNRSGITSLDEQGRVHELSRMLAGLEGSSLAQGHAGELLAAASGFKQQL